MSETPPDGIRKATGRGGTSYHYEIIGSPVYAHSFLSKLLLKEFKELTKACLKAGVQADHLCTILAEQSRGGRK